MLFNSLEFAIFLPIVFALYWCTPVRYSAVRNIIILVASYIFYGWWDWRFLSLIFLSSIVDYSVALGLKSSMAVHKRRILLTISILTNLGLLGVFKYFNFFIESMEQAFTFFGHHIEASRLNIILPVGISFYTFQTLSYSIDVYRRKLEPTRDAISFFAYVSFFPQLVAGPIERASNLLPQFFEHKIFSYQQASDGMRQILWGLFKKVVIADNCAAIVNATFSDPSGYSSSTLLVGAVLFAFQIYGDFSGYSDIAIGTAKLFGFNLKQNFAFPYFSRDIAEFWRRWHMSLTSWFRDYLYIPLGGSKGTKLLTIRNTTIVFLVSGFWHGANWTFIFWGALHALYFLPLLITNRNRRNLAPIEGALPNIREILAIVWTFILVDIAWIFFRAPSIEQAFIYLKSIFTPSIFSKPELLSSQLILGLMILLAVEWLNRTESHGLVIRRLANFTYCRWAVYLFFALAILLFGGTSETFIYFQF